MPVSIALTLWRETSIRSARSCWLQLRSARRRRRRFSISSRRRRASIYCRWRRGRGRKTTGLRPNNRPHGQPGRNYRGNPRSSHAESEGACKERLADHQHSDIFVLLFDQVATYRAEDPDDRKRRKDSDKIFERARHQLVLEPVHRREKESDIDKAEPDYAQIISFPGGGSTMSSVLV